MCKHSLRDYGLLWNLLPLADFFPFSSIVPTLCSESYRMFSLRCSVEILPFIIPGVSLVSSTERVYYDSLSTTTPSLHVQGVYSFPHIQLYRINIMVIIPSPPYFRNVYYSVCPCRILVFWVQLCTPLLSLSWHFPAILLRHYLPVWMPLHCLCQALTSP